MNLPLELADLFRQQRRRLRRVLTWELVARIIAAAAIALGVGLMLDWFFEPAPGVRQAAMLAAAFGVFLWVARTTLEPLLRPITDRQMASLIEKRRPEFGDSLLTAVDLASDRGGGRNKDAFDPLLADATTSRVIETLHQVGDPRIIVPTRAQRWTRIAMLGVFGLGAFAAAYPDAAAVYARRLALSPDPWPRRVVLSLEGFTQEEDGVWRRRVARGDSLDIAVRADLTGEHECPDTVWLRYRFENGPRGKESFAKIGEPTMGEGANQLFRHTLADITSDVDLRIEAGDGRIKPIEVVVAPRPIVTSAEIELTPPSYLDMPARRVPAEAAGELPEGSAVTAKFVASKPLLKVDAGWAGGEGPPLEVAFAAGEKAFAVVCPPLFKSRVLEVRLTDTDRIESADPHPLAIAIQPDKLPVTRLELVGVGSAVTPDAEIGLRINARDDHRLDAVRIEVAVDDSPAEPRSLSLTPQETSECVRDVGVDLLTERFASGADAGRLRPGQRIALVALASDRFDLRDESRETSSQRFAIEVVTPDQLLARIEQREQNLRRTFEQTVADARRLERLLEAWKPETPSSGASGETTPPDDAPQPRSDRLRQARLADSVAKLRQETLSVGDQFHAIHEELVHNRIQNSDILDRVENKIAQPLLSLAEQDIAKLQRAVRDAADGAQITADAGAVAEQMERILEQMKSLETYNEVLALLRQVIDDQQRVRRATEKTRRDQVRRLLLE